MILKTLTAQEYLDEVEQMTNWEDHFYPQMKRENLPKELDEGNYGDYYDGR